MPFLRSYKVFSDARHVEKRPPNKNGRSRDQPFYFDTGKTTKAYRQRPLSEIESIEIHHLVPGRDEITNELLLRIRASINLGQRTQL